MRILFMGTSEFAVPALNELIVQKFNIVGVVTQPDRPKGRGRKLSPSPVKALATEHNLQIIQPKKIRIKESVEVLLELKPDVIVVAAFGQLLPQTVLDIPPCGVINIHPSILPKYRGAAPIQWAVINGEKETGVSLMLLDQGEDTGDVISIEKVGISDEDTAQTIHDKLADLGAKRLADLLSNLSTERPPSAIPQNHDDATHAPRLTKEIGHINWHHHATAIHNLIRGTVGWPGAATIYGDGLQVKIIKTIPHPKNNTIVDTNLQKQPGTIKVTPERKLYVVTGEGELQILQVQPATKGVMEVGDFINGYHLMTGDRFYRLENTQKKLIDYE
ncbi:methionyl-tRNA formyltransferase [Candidatus Poribacteria bacterium]|nr:MAG: methionyl-tRNA formyltransferase [Candidatus Poribacteria bacterium]